MTKMFTSPQSKPLPAAQVSGRPLVMCDVQGLHQRLANPLQQAWELVQHHGRYIQGPEVQQIEQQIGQYLGGGVHTVSCGSGTGALRLIFEAAGLSKGAHVLVPAFTYIAAAEAIAQSGLVPIPIEVDAHTQNITAATLAQGLTPQTEAVVAVHLFGRAAPMDEILTFCEKNKLFLVEDTAQALGATALVNGQPKAAGTIGHAAAFSFFPTKPLGGLGDGGLVATPYQSLAQKVRKLSLHGKGTHKYEHTAVGDNNRLDTLQAACLLAKLPYLEHCHQLRTEAAHRYHKLLQGNPHITLPEPPTPNTRLVWHQYTIKTPHRQALQHHLTQHGIPTMIYYPMPQHAQPAYANPSHPIGSLPVSEALCDQVLSLPIHTEITPQQQQLVAQTINSFRPC